MTAGFVTSDGRTLAYRRFGSGPLLVCHPGGPGFPGATLGELGRLAGEHELVILDLRGAAAHPAQVRRLVLVSTAPRFAQKYTDAINTVWDASADPRVAEARRAREQHLSGAVRDRDEFTAGIPDARRVVLDEAGHFAWADTPGQFCEEVSRFLAG
jgi:pimeloyl-ACP methyl ester carboxylesterase